MVVAPPSYEHAHVSTGELSRHGLHPTDACSPLKHTEPDAGASPTDGCGVLSQPCAQQGCCWRGLLEGLLAIRTPALPPKRTHGDAERSSAHAAKTPVLSHWGCCCGAKIFQPGVEDGDQVFLLQQLHPTRCPGEVISIMKSAQSSSSDCDRLSATAAHSSGDSNSPRLAPRSSPVHWASACTSVKLAGPRMTSLCV